MVKPKKFTQIKAFDKGVSLRQYLNDNPNELRAFVNNNIDFDDMGFDIRSDNVCCPFCEDTGFHGKVNYNETTGMHNIYCYRCSGSKNNNRPYSPWDYVTQIYRIQEGGLTYLNAVVSLYNSFEDFQKAYEGYEVEIKTKVVAPNIDKQQEFIDKILSNCNNDILSFIDELYGNCSIEKFKPYLNLYKGIKHTVANTEWEGEIDQNVKIFSNSNVPIKVITLKMFDRFVSQEADSNNIRQLFTDGTEFLYLIPTVSPNGKIVQIAFRIGNGNTNKYKPKVKKAKGDFEEINIPMMFGFHNFQNFKQGMPIVLVEGEKDAIALQTIYPFALAMGRNTLGSNIKYLKYLTNKFVIIPDNDERAGEEGFERIKQDMEKYGLKLNKIVISNPKLKDVADIYTKSPKLWKQLKGYMEKLKQKYNILN